MTQRKLRILSTFAAIAFFGLLTAASACKVAGGTPSDRRIFSESLFVGIVRIISVENREIPAAKCDSVVCTYALVGYEVIEGYKDVVGNSGRIRVGNCVPCSFCMEIGQTYLIFVSTEESVSPLHGSALLDEEGWIENKGRIQALRDHSYD